ncbi:MAG: hypothetical protein AAGC55_19910, partial [Myxococcota bacterium]
ERAAEAERARMPAALADRAQAGDERATLDAADKSARASTRRTGSAAGTSSRRPSSSGGGGQRSNTRTSAGAAGRRSSLDDELRQMRDQAGKQKATVDDELAALKRKMKSKKKP